jgi:transposase
VEKYQVDLTDKEYFELQNLCSKGKHPARKIRKANILLEAAAGKTDDEIAQNLHVGTATVQRTRKRFVEGNLEYALNDCFRDGRPKVFDGIQEAALVALACTNPPKGRAAWTVELLTEKMVLLGIVETISRESVRLMLNKNELKPWQKQEWCIPKIDAEYVWRMEDVLELYADPFDENQPVVCFDETPHQLIEESRPSIPMRPGQPLRQDYEYKRKGSANIFLFVQPLAGWRHTKTTSQRTRIDFAGCMLDLATVHFPNAAKIHVVLDNLNTHSPSTLYEILPPREAREIVRRLEFHYTPKHASWLNIAEIEFSVLNRQCLNNRYISSIELLEKEVLAWESERNAKKAKVEWMFAIEDARKKMGHLYPKLLQMVASHLEENAQGF